MQIGINKTRNGVAAGRKSKVKRGFKIKKKKLTVENDPEKQKRGRNAGRMSLRRRERVNSNGQLVGMAFSRGKDS